MPWACSSLKHFIPGCQNISLDDFSDDNFDWWCSEHGKWVEADGSEVDVAKHRHTDDRVRSATPDLHTSNAHLLFPDPLALQSHAAWPRPRSIGSSPGMVPSLASSFAGGYSQASFTLRRILATEQGGLRDSPVLDEEEDDQEEEELYSAGLASSWSSPPSPLSARGNGSTARILHFVPGSAVTTPPRLSSHGSLLSSQAGLSTSADRLSDRGPAVQPIDGPRVRGPAADSMSALTRSFMDPVPAHPLRRQPSHFGSSGSGWPRASGSGSSSSGPTDLEAALLSGHLHAALHVNPPLSSLTKCTERFTDLQSYFARGAQLPSSSSSSSSTGASSVFLSGSAPTSAVSTSSSGCTTSEETGRCSQGTRGTSDDSASVRTVEDAAADVGSLVLRRVEARTEDDDPLSSFPSEAPRRSRSSGLSSLKRSLLKWTRSAGQPKSTSSD